MQCNLFSTTPEFIYIGCLQFVLLYQVSLFQYLVLQFKVTVFCLAYLSFRCWNSDDVLGKSLANLQKEFNNILADAQREKEKAWIRQRQLQEEIASQQEKLDDVQEKYRQACIKTTKARVRKLQLI